MTTDFCRVCLDGNVAMYYISGEFREIYEKLANTTLNTGDGRPETLCYICFSNLRRCYKFSKLCKKSEQILINLGSYGFEMTTQTIDMLNYGNGMKKKYSVSDLSLTILPPPINNHCQEVLVKNEVTDVIKNEVTENSEDDDTDCSEASELHTNEEDIVTGNIILNEPYWDVCSKITQNHKEKEICFVGKGTLVEEKETLIGEKEIHYEENEMLVEGAGVLNGQEINAREKCISLNKQLIDVGNIVEYTQKQSKPKPFYSCSHCSETFTNKKKMVSHFSNTHKPKRIVVAKEYHCDLCSKKYTKRNLFNNHMNQHMKGRAYVCTICNKGFYVKMNLDRHMKIHTGDKPYTCDKCNKTFIQKAHLKIHSKVHANGKKQYTCRNTNRSGQLKIREKPICDICKRQFFDKVTLRKHIKLHTGERPYPCKLCNKAYIQSSGLKSHMKTHLKVKNTIQVCHICGKIFNKRRLLNMHIKVHTRNHLCTICAKTYPTKTSLDIHICTHAKVKAHTCNFCGKKFSLYSTLHVHLRTHTGVKPYTCHDCGKTFSQKICLIKHTRVHTGIKPYACNKCDRTFTQKNSLAHHLKSRYHRFT